MTTHTDPRHDPRPWQDCTREDIRKGDLVEARLGGFLFIGVAHHQDEDDDWFTEDGYLLSCGDNWPLRRIPAPAPPAEEVELPTEHPAHLLDVETVHGSRCAYMALDNTRRWCGVNQDGRLHAYRPHALATFTLPGGTRARRNGERADGSPRFVKVQEEGK